MKNFCVLPWVHYHSLPTGETRLCCLSDSAQADGPFASPSSSIAEKMNSAAHKNARRQLMNDQRPAQCHKCYHMDDIGLPSMRTGYNSRFESQIPELLSKTDEHGELNDISLKYLDIRFSNVCNFKCRTCYHGLSSSWFLEQQKLYDEKITTKIISNNSYQDIEPYLKDVEKIYFAGGEPLVTPEHYMILDWLIQNNRTHVELVYNSNLSILSYKGKHVLDYWKKFPNLLVGASIDAMGSDVEYIRTNIKWKDFAKNYAALVENHINVFPSLTISNLNILPVLDLVRFLLDNKWISSHTMPSINFVTHPEWFSAVNLPESFKAEVVAAYEAFDWGDIIEAKHKILAFLASEGNTSFVSQLQSMLEKSDKLNGTSWQTLPHLRSIFSHISISN